MPAEILPRSFSHLSYVCLTPIAQQIAALILENTFTNLPRLVPHALPLLSPLTFLCNQKWDSASKIPFIPKSTPILMLSGVQDEVVPPQHMQELWAIITRRQGSKVRTDGEPKATASEVDGGRSKFVEFPGGSHSTSFQHLTFSSLVCF